MSEGTSMNRTSWHFFPCATLRPGTHNFLWLWSWAIRVNRTLKWEQKTLLCFSGGLTGNRTRAGLSPREQKHHASWWRPHSLGAWYLPEYLQGVYRLTVNIHHLLLYFTLKRVKRDVYLGSTLDICQLHVLNKSTVHENTLRVSTVSSLSSLVSSAASVGHTRSWSPWTCLSSGDPLLLETGWFSTPLSTIHFRPGKARVMLLGGYEWIQTCTWIIFLFLFQSGGECRDYCKVSTFLLIVFEISLSHQHL